MRWWILPGIKWVLAVALFFLLSIITLTMLQVKDVNTEILEISEELERAKSESANEKKLWTTIAPSEYPIKVRQLIEDTTKAAQVQMASPLAPFRLMKPSDGNIGQVTRWMQASYVVSIVGSIDHILKFFYLLKKDPFVVEVAAWNLKELEKKWTVTAIVGISGLGWPVESTGFHLSSKIIETIEEQASGFDASFQAAAQKKKLPAVPEKPQPAWSLIASAGGSIYLSQENPEEGGPPLTKILSQGDVLYGWTVDISKETIREGILLKKGSRELWWPMGGLFNGVEVKRK